MFDNGSIIVGLEVGTSKVCAVVGEITGGEGGSLNIVGLGQAPSRGVRKGEIVDAALAREDIQRALVEAEEMADVMIRSCYLSVTGSHIRGFNNRGVHPVVSADREITEEDVQDVIKNAKAINIPAQNCIVHAIRQFFCVDGQEGLVNIVGRLGTRIEVDMHVVHGSLNRLQTPVRLVKELQLEVESVVFSGIASALALLTNEQKEVGSLVIDLGAGTTEYVVYAGGIIQHTGVLAVGGDHVSNDLAYGLKVPLTRAEKLKLEHGSAVFDDSVKGQSLTLTGDSGATRIVNLENLRRIMTLRLEEIFQLIAQDLDQAGMMERLRAGVFLCGGGARIPNIARLAEQVLDLPVTLGKTNSISGLKSALDQPEFATGIGLVKFGSFQQRRQAAKASLTSSIKSTFNQFFRRPST